MTESGSKLEYAATAPGLRAVRVRRWVTFATASFLIAGAALLVPRYLDHARVLLQQRQLRSWSASPTQVVFTNVAADAKKLLTNSPRYLATPAGDAAYLVSDVWMQFYSQLAGGYQTSGTIFAGELRTKDGRRALVSIDLNFSTIGDRQWAMIGTHLVKPGTSYRSPEPALSSAVRGDGGRILIGPGDTLVVYAAQVDPDDPSHVTVDYLLNNTRHTIDGWLDDAWMIVLESRD